MKTWVRNRRLAAGILVIFLVGLSSTAFAAAGRTIGTFQVSPRGGGRDVHRSDLGAPWADRS